MKVAQARALAEALNAAADAADVANSPDVDLTSALQAQDDAARKELQQAIDSAT